jgi:hypothetical protein
MPEPICMKPGMYVMAPEPISTAYFINPSQQSVCMYVYFRVSLLDNGSVETLQRKRIHTLRLAVSRNVLSLLFNPECGGTAFLRNAGNFIPDYTEDSILQDQNGLDIA